LRDTPSDNPRLDLEKQYYEGEFWLIIRCPWRIEFRDKMITSWLEENRAHEITIGAFDLCINQPVKAVELMQPGLDLTLRFPNSFVLRAFCDITNENSHKNYIYATPEASYAVLPYSILEIELEDD
jgi:hypothetical protein